MGKFIQKLDLATNQRVVGLIVLDELDTEVTDEFLKTAGNDFAGYPTLSLATSDMLLGEDASASNAKGKLTVQQILDLVPDSGLPTGTTDLALISWDSATGAYVERAKVRVDANGKLLLNRTTGTGPTLDIAQTVNGTVIVVDNSGVNNYMELKDGSNAGYTFGKAAFLIYNDVYVQNQKTVFFKELATNGSNYIGVKAPANLTVNTTYTLPTADGTAGQSLKTDGSGNLYWG